MARRLNKKSFIIGTILEIIIMITAILPAAYAQESGQINGRVIDSATGDPIIGVNVIVKGKDIFAVTDLNGRYTLQNIPAGNIEITFLMMGYGRSEERITLKPGESAALNISLSYKTADEIVVTGRKISNTDASLLNKRKKAPVAQDAISAEQIAKSPDSDASEAAKRITGVTIVDGKTVFIRGLGERYSSVMLAGSTIPSPDPDKRVVPLDIFPAVLLDNLVIIKAYTPDFPGEFGGGIVQINPKDYPDKTSLKISLGTGYHQNTTGKDFLTYSGGKYDFFGIDDGTRDVPGRLRDDYLNTFNYSSEETEAIGEELKNEYTPDNTEGKLPMDFSFTFGDTYTAGIYKIGLIISGLFKENSKNRDIHFLRVSDNWNTLQEYDIKKSTYSTNKGFLLSTALNGMENKLRFTGFYSHQSEDNTSIYRGYNNDRQESAADAKSMEKRYKLQFINEGLLFTQLEGEHYISPLFKSTLNWTGTFSHASRKEPDTRTVQLIDTESTGDYFVYRSDDIKRMFLNHGESVYDFSPSITVPFKQWNSLMAKMKIGGDYTYRKRVSDSRTFVWENSGVSSLANTPEPVENLFTPENIVGYSEYDDTHYYLREISAQNDSYTGILTIIAGFGQVDIPLMPKLRLVGGLRYEYSDMDVISYNPVTTEEEDLENEPLKRNNYMPAASLTYSVTDNTNIRLAYSKTVIRPDFREVTEFKYPLMVSNEMVKGNPELVQSDIYNYDFRFEWFPSASEILALSFFYKDMINPIEMLEITGSAGTATYQYANADKAKNMGAELEFKKGFSFVSDFLKDFSILTNLAYIYSEVEVEDKPYADYSSNSRPLQGQSPYVLNAGLNYENEPAGFSGTILYNIYGRRIMRVGTVYAGNKRGDVYEESVGKLDFTARQKIPGNGQIKFTASNILDPEIRQTQERPNSQTGKKKTFTLESYRDGRNYSISYSYSF